MSEQVVLDREAPPWAQRLQTDINTLMMRLDRRVKTVNSMMTGGSTSLQGQIDDLVADVTALEALRLTSGTYAPTTSGTSIDFTGIPAGVRLITVSFVLVSTSGTSLLQLQLGDSGGVETTGYHSQSAAVAAGPATAAANSTTGLLLQPATSATYTHSGIATLALADPATNTWSFSAIGTRNSASVAPHFSAGSKPLSAALDRIRLTTAGGADTFDGGGVNILYE